MKAARKGSILVTSAILAMVGAVSAVAGTTTNMWNYVAHEVSSV